MALVIQAIVNLLKEIDVGNGNTMQVGDGTDPNHEPPYLVVTQPSSLGVEGSMLEGDEDSDETVRVQITGVGDLRYQADWARDQARIALTRRNLKEHLDRLSAGRSVIKCELDFSTQDRWDRGIGQTVYSAVDQYLITTTPN